MFPLFLFFLGLIFGSFFNVVILRLHAGTSIIAPPSACPKCRVSLAWFDNLPVISFLLLRGRCRNCRKKISWQYPLVEMATGLLFFWVGLRFGQSLPALVVVGFTGFLLLLFLYDLRYYQVPDSISLPALGFGLFANLWLGVAWSSLAIGILVGAGFFLFQYVVSGGRWIGSGDIRLGGMMGAMLGWQGLLVALFLAYVLGSIVGVGLLAARKKQLSSTVPFGTFLTAATFISLLYGPQLIDAYLSLRL
jgi:prepilin signal peptidase PulO-like enzyme (type II secretory pathway)